MAIGLQQRVLLLHLLLVGCVTVSSNAADDVKIGLPKVFSFKAQVRTFWDADIRLFSVSYLSGLTNMLGIQEIRSTNRTLNLYNFNVNTHFQIRDSSCEVRNLSSSSFNDQMLFPVNFDGTRFNNPNSLLRLSSKYETYSKEMGTVKVNFTKKHHLKPQNSGIHECVFQATFSRLGTPTPWCTSPKNCRSVPLKLIGTCRPIDSKETDASKAMIYEIFDFRETIRAQDLQVPDGCVCTAADSKRMYRPIKLVTPKAVQFVRRGSMGKAAFFVDENLSILRADDPLQGQCNVIDFANRLAYWIDMVTGACRVTVYRGRVITAAESLYGFEPRLMQVVKETPEDTIHQVVYSGMVGNSTNHVANIYFVTHNGEPAEPLKVVFHNRNDLTIDVMRIEAFSQNVSWQAFNVVQGCFARTSEDIFLIYLDINGFSDVGPPMVFERQLLQKLKQWTSIKQPLRFSNIQLYNNGSVSFHILPRHDRPVSVKDEPLSPEAVQRIVATVKSGKAYFTNMKGVKSVVTLVTYETIGAPQATYRAESVLLISLSVMAVAILAGLGIAFVFARTVPKYNRIRLFLGV